MKRPEHLPESLTFDGCGINDRHDAYTPPLDYAPPLAKVVNPSNKIMRARAQALGKAVAALPAAHDALLKGLALVASCREARGWCDAHSADTSAAPDDQILDQFEHWCTAALWRAGFTEAE